MKKSRISSPPSTNREQQFPIAIKRIRIYFGHEYIKTVIAQKNEQRRINYKAGIKKKREDYHTRGISLVSIHTVPLPPPVLYFRRIILLVRNRAALVIMNDCKYTSFQVTWSTMPRFHPRPSCSPPFFLSIRTLAFFGGGTQGRRGWFRIRSISSVSFPASVSPVIRANFHRYRHGFFSTDTTRFSCRREIGPRYFYLRSVHMNGRRGRGFFLEIPFRVPFGLFAGGRQRERGGEVQVVHALRRAFPGSFCIVAHTGERNEWHESRGREGINICEGGFSSEREQGFSRLFHRLGYRPRLISSGWVN